MPVDPDDGLFLSETAFVNELVRCLERFLDGTVDEPTLARARRLLGSGQVRPSADLWPAEGKVPFPRDEVGPSETRLP